MAVPNDPEPNTQIFVLLLLVVVVLIIGSLKARKSDDDDITTSFKNIPYIFFQFENARSYNKVLTYILFALHTTTRRYTEMSSSSSSSSSEEDKDKKSQSVVVDASWRVEVPIASKEHRDQKRVRYLLFRVLCRFAFVCLARFESPLLTTHTFFQSSSHADEREEAFSHGERGVDAAREDGWDWRESCDHDHSIDGRRCLELRDSMDEAAKRVTEVMEKYGGNG